MENIVRITQSKEGTKIASCEMDINVGINKAKRINGKLCDLAT